MNAVVRPALGRFGGLLKGRSPKALPSPPVEDGDTDLAVRLFCDFERSGGGWFWASDAEGRLIYISPSVPERHGVPREDLIGRAFHSLFVLDRDEDDRIERTLPLILSARKTFSALPVRGATASAEVWWAISGRPQYDGEGTFLGYYGNGSDVTASRQSERDASRMAMFDSLTDLSNRHRMEKRLTATLTAYRAAKRVCALLMIDLDRFKQVNDTLGHPAGDELLKQVAQRLKRVIPEGAEIGRLGGDEFQVMLPDVDDRGRLGEIARKVIDIISQPYTIEGSRCVIGASVGIAIAPYDGVESDELVRSADLALYAAKGGGRGQFRFYSADLHNEAERRRQIEDDLRDALTRDELYLAYQPIVDVHTQKVVTLEAVMRWEHPDLGNVPPGVFIPIAEDCNLIAPMGDWALRTACDAAVKLPGNVRMAVNVSPAQFVNPAFPAVVAQALAASGLAPDRLELEVTESIFLADDEVTGQTFKALKILGVRLALDDFGTGYSALGYLQKADFNKIKIDQGFIRGVTEEGSRNVAIIKSIVSLAEGLNMQTTAEGIEAHDELAMMRSLGVSQIQGFIYARPVVIAEVLAAMASGEWFIEPNGPSKYRADRMTMFRKIGLIHEDHRYDCMMRNLSRTGCLVEGLMDVPAGTQFVIDFGEGQLAVGVVRRSADSLMGLEFETSLVDDGAGGLCTRHRVSPYVLAAAGMPLAALPQGQYPLVGQTGAAFAIPRFAQAPERAKGERAKTERGKAARAG